MAREPLQSLFGKGPGFESETSSAEVVIYPHGDDRILKQTVRHPVEFTAARSSDDITKFGSLINASSQKSMGAASGTWNFTVKVPKDFRRDFREMFSDDDWVDLTFLRHGRRYHTMRGPLDNIRRVTNVGASGATEVSYIFSGRDHGKIFEETKVWFNNFTGENAVGGATLRAAAAAGAIFGTGDVSQVVRAFLFSFLDVLNDFGRSIWRMPSGMPGITDDSKVIENLAYIASNFNDPPRRVVNPNMIQVNQSSLWQMAQEWGDPQMMELYVDLVDSKDRVPDPNAEITNEDTVMAVILRERPFPTSATLEKFKKQEVAYWRQSILGEQAVINARNDDITTLRDSEWFSLPTAIISPHEIGTNSEVSRGGIERINAVDVSPLVIQEIVGQHIELEEPLLDRESIEKHGVRRLTYYTNYVSDDGGGTDIARIQRQKLADWFCLNPYFYNGTLPLTHGRPDIRIGMRAFIPSEQGPDFDEHYYVESVAHTWSLDPGVRTTLGVTRGWLGSEANFVTSLQRAAEAFKTPARAAAGIPTGTPLELDPSEDFSPPAMPEEGNVEIA